MQTVRWIFLLIWPFFFSGKSMPVADKGGTRWITLRQASEQLRSQKKPVLIDLYTDWCGWCKVMDKKTYTNKKVSDYLATRFYAVKVNAETRETLEWGGKQYLFNERYRTNDFAIFLTQGQLSYPTTVILAPEGGAPQAIPGYMEPRDFELILKYFGEKHYLKTPFDAFQKTFTPTW